jgi:hypothetical protein
MSDQPAPAPDPVGDPKAYQDLLLGALGGDDPATVQSGTPAALRQLADDAGMRIRTRPAPGEWSVLEVMGHILDAEVVSASRYRFIVTQDEPALIGYDQDRWVQGLHHNDDDVAALLDHFEAIRLANVAMWRRSNPTERSRVGRHAERGPESYDLSFRLIAGHDRVHLAQARDALRASAPR